jgi:chromatin modification-related protein EAF6
MAENIPPTSATSGGAPAPNDNATRGLPYYEQLKRNLRETLHKKRILDKNLVGPA